MQRGVQLLLALREALMMAYNFNWHRVIMESDCLPLIEACRKEKNHSRDPRHSSGHPYLIIGLHLLWLYMGAKARQLIRWPMS
ncbi:Reverse transcriptase-like [Sesbania bispinosa]|nr:Reverse transcriptase-like [Sesbania bispinosa]